MNILVTGGTGFIGSHTAIELLESNNEVIIVDNLYNSKKSVVESINKITNKNVKFYDCDVCDIEALDRIFKENTIDACIHFAAYKAVGESVHKPLDYYRNNLMSTIALLTVMEKNNCKKIIFSSSATVYGDSKIQPITEDCPIGTCSNPYGWTKEINEQILKDYYNAHKDWHIILLRYFNPLGAHKSGLLGDNPNGIPTNLMPYITQVAAGKLPYLKVYGNDYNTPDGTCLRDYIHVLDLATGHTAAMKKFNDISGLYIYNLGTGKAFSVLDVINTFSKVNNIKIKYTIEGRREGDVAICYADPNKALNELGWKAKYTLEDMCRDSWNWQKKNIND